MSHQDWKPIIFKKPQPKIVLKSSTNKNTDENLKLDKVSRNLSLAIQQARMLKGWSRKELASRLNVKENVIEDYETQKAIPNDILIQKIAIALNTKLSKKM